MMTTSFTSKIVVSAALVCLTAACGETGESGSFRLKEVSADYVGDLRPIAEGRELHYEVVDAGLGVRRFVATHAISSDKNVLNVDLEEDGRVRVTGVSAGDSTLHVGTQGGLEDFFELEVRPAVNAWIDVSTTANNSKHVWGRFPLGQKFNLLTDTPYDVNVHRFMDSLSQPLSGAGGEELQLSNVEDTSCLRITPRELGYHWTLSPMSENCETTVRSDDFGKDTPFRVSSDFEPASLRLSSSGAWLDANVVVEGDRLRARPGATVGLTFHAYDADDHVYLGAFPIDARIEVDDAQNFAPRLASHLTETDDANQCAEQLEGTTQCKRWEKVEELRVVVTMPRQEATTTLTVGSGEQEYVLTLESDESVR